MIQQLVQPGFGTRLHAMRRSRKLSQRDLAQASGVSQRMIAYYETHPESNPTIDKAIPLAQALGVPVEALAGQQETVPQKKRSSFLWKQFQLLEQLPKKQRDVIVQQIEALAR